MLEAIVAQLHRLKDSTLLARPDLGERIIFKSSLRNPQYLKNWAKIEERNASTRLPLLTRYMRYKG